MKPIWINETETETETTAGTKNMQVLESRYKQERTGCRPSGKYPCSSLAQAVIKQKQPPEETGKLSYSIHYHKLRETSTAANLVKANALLYVGISRLVLATNTSSAGWADQVNGEEGWAWGDEKYLVMRASNYRYLINVGWRPKHPSKATDIVSIIRHTHH